MQQTNGVNPNTTGNPQGHAQHEREKDDFTLATLSPPPSTPRVGIQTPSFDGDFRVICRGDEYGSVTHVAFRQITESNAAYECFCGVAVELESVSGFSDEKAVVSRLMSDLRIPEIEMSEIVPPFVAVPRPEKTVLFLSSQDPAVTPLRIAKAVQEHLSKLNTRTRIQSTLDAGNVAQPKQYVDLSSILLEAGKMTEQLKASSAFPTWRPIHWSALQVAATEALRLMLNGATAEECASMLQEKSRQLGVPKVTTEQKALVTEGFLSTANKLAERQAEAVSV